MTYSPSHQKLVHVLLMQVMHTREDHVITICHPDGLVIVEHSDGTRITTKHQLRDPLEEDVTEQQQQRMENEVVTARQEEENQRYTEVGEVKEQMEGEQEMNKFYISNAKEKITGSLQYLLRFAQPLYKCLLSVYICLAHTESCKQGQNSCSGPSPLTLRPTPQELLPRLYPSI